MNKLIAVLAGAVVLAGCSSAPASTPETPSPSPEKTIPVVGEFPSPSPSPEKPLTAEEIALIKADGRRQSDPGIQQFLEAAHNLCTQFALTTDEDIFAALKDSQVEDRRTAGRILLHLCDDTDRYMPLVVAAELDESFASGTYYVGDGDNEIKPGTYKTIGGVKDCYWVRKNEAGKIIANDLVSNAPGGVRMTVKASDYEVTMERCGAWVPAG